MATLETYRKKRDFKATSEPRGAARKKKAAGDSFVIQKHDATRLHYDLRLEMDGVLKSWAVTRGPSLVPGEKRLAVHVEDHPLEYGDFEGTIPKGEYGGGTVIVWDRGTWAPVHDPERGYAKGHLEFALTGEKLHGRWHLVKMAPRPREKRENWLLIKAEDEFARTEDEPDILVERPDSVKTGRTVEDVAGEAPGWSSKTGRIDKSDSEKPAKPSAKKPAAKKPADNKAASSPSAEAPAKAPPAKAAKATARKPATTGTIKGAKKAKLPDFVPPMLATLVAKPPEGPDWIHEIKFDGYRLEARIENGKVKLLTRSGLDWTDRFGTEVPAALAALPLDTALFDGELVVEGGAGASDFSALQADLSDGRSDRFVFYLFDLMHLDGQDVTGVPLVERKHLLEHLLEGADPVLRFSDHFGEDGALVLRHACRLSLEGVVSKRADAPYRPGRGRNWVKSKCSARQEFVIGGYVLSTVSDKAIGSLVMGVNEEGGLRHVGRVGTGYTAKVAEDLFKRLETLRADDSPFAETLTADARRGVRYVKPELVAEVEFRAWTGDGHLRHAAFRGLRDDKPAAEIVREAPASKTPDKPPRRTVKLTHPDRVYWPDAGITKEGLADYYAEVWRFIAPFVTGRPLALLRCPDGIDGSQKFFQKNAWKGMNANIHTVDDPSTRETEQLIAIRDLDGLIGLVQSAALEIHPWGSTVADWEHPDMIVMDLDPGEGVSWERIIEAALEVKSRLEAVGLVPFVKTSGGKGLHVCAPLKPKADWPSVKAFTKALADSMAADEPDRYVSTVTKSKRVGKILIDYLRNQRGATAVAPYSTRARPGAAVSMPLDWSELGPDIGPATFTVQNAPTRLANLKSDPWADFRKSAKVLKV
jgi:bifunctional non-homologous end joining protein LigD